MKIEDKFNEYIIFTPLKAELQTMYLRYEDKYIEVNYNCDKSIFYDAYNKNYILNNITSNLEKIGDIQIIIDNDLFPCRYKSDEYYEGQFIKKNHPMYLEGRRNNFFETDDLLIFIYHYPNEYINIIKKNSTKFMSIVKNNNDALQQLVYGIKKILAGYNAKKGIYTIHGSAVKKDGEGSLFIGGSYSGKTTIFLNMISNGYYPINDDIVFWYKKNNKIYIKGSPIVLHKRKNSDELNMSSKIHNSNELLDYINMVYDENEVVLKNIFISKFGFDGSNIKKLDNIDHKKFLRACTVHYSIEVDENFYDAYTQLISLSIYNLEMSKDYNSVLKCIESVTNCKN